MGRVTSRRRVVPIDGGDRTVRPDTLVVEEPLEIRVAGRPLVVTIRTPGDDFDLVKTSIDAVRTAVPWPPHAGGQPGDRVVNVSVLADLPNRLRAAQQVFDRTGGLHAAGVFTMGGRLLCVREDVGRHNAVDKVVGWGLREGRLPMTDCVLQVSGRASFELAQKAPMNVYAGERRLS